MVWSTAIDILSIPSKYTRHHSELNKVEIIAHKSWLRNLRKYHRVPDFVFHEKYSDDEVLALLLQGESFGPGWVHCFITVIEKKEKTVIPLPRARIPTKNDSQLSFSQILQYVAQANHKNLWKEAYKKYSYGCWKSNSKEESCIQFMEYNEVLKEIICRMYGITVFKLGDMNVVKDSPYQRHANILPAYLAVETTSAILLIQEGSGLTLHDCVSYSPSKLSSSTSGSLLVIYQLLQLMRHLHDTGLVLGDITLSDIHITDHLWISVAPRLVDNICEQQEQLWSEDVSFSKSQSEVAIAHLKEENVQKEKEDSSVKELGELCLAWVRGAISNYDYLLALNRLANRSLQDPTRHYIMPWVSDLTTRSGPTWRDLSKSKFRLNKGDAQLDLTYNIDTNSNQIPHHVPEVLSEITYYVYLCRVTPKTVLCKYVRSIWVPAEYPSSIQRLYQWTPDECVPQFYSDPSVFKSIHNDLCDLEIPSWASSAQDFVTQHRAMLESHHVSARLHQWIDLNFGYKLSGAAAIKAKNVMLPLSDSHTMLCRGGVVQLLSTPHPQRSFPSPYWGKAPPTASWLSGNSSGDDHHHSHHHQQHGHHHHHQRQSVRHYRSSSSGPSNAAGLANAASGSTKYGGDEDCTPLEDDEQSRRVSLGNRLNYRTPSLVYQQSQAGEIQLPKDYNTVAALLAVESLHSVANSSLVDSKCSPDPSVTSSVSYYKQLIAGRRVREMQVLGCIIVEMLLANRIRQFGAGTSDLSFSRRLEVCQSVTKLHMDSLPRSVHPIIKLLLIGEGGYASQGSMNEVYKCITEAGCPPPSPHQLLQPLLSPIAFAPLLPLLYSTILSLHSLNTTLAEADSPDHIHHSSPDPLILHRIIDMKIKAIMPGIERMTEESGPCLKLLVPHISALLIDPRTDVITAWYLFDNIAKSLGPVETCNELLEPMTKLYDWDRANHSDPRLLHKRIKLYHRSFILKLIVRFGPKVFLDSFIVPLVEAVGGYHDLEQTNYHSKLDYGEGDDSGVLGESGVTSPLSPLDDLSRHSDSKSIRDEGGEGCSVDTATSPPSRKNPEKLPTKSTDPEPEVFHLEEEGYDQVKRGPRSAKSLQNLLIDQIDTGSDEKESSPASGSDCNKVLTQGSVVVTSPVLSLWHHHSHMSSGSSDTPHYTMRQMDHSSSSNMNPYDQAEIEHSKYVMEVCQVSSDTVGWLAARLGPVLTALSLSRNLLRMLSLCYTGQESLMNVSRANHHLLPSGLHQSSVAASGQILMAQVIPPFALLTGDSNAALVIQSLKAIAGLYGEQVIVVQYLPHMVELIAHSKRKLTPHLEGGIVASLELLANIVDLVSDSTFVDILLEVIIHGILEPSLRLIASCSSPMPSGTLGRQAVASKLVRSIIVLVNRAEPQQRILLLQTLSRFFLAFSKALSLSPPPPQPPSSTQQMSHSSDLSRSPYEMGDQQIVGGINIKTKVRDCHYQYQFQSESPPFSLPPQQQLDSTDKLRSKAMEELKETLTAEFAYKSYVPFANFFGESLMEQSLRNYSLIKDLCSDFMMRKRENRIPVDNYDVDIDLTPHSSSESSVHVGSFGNVVLVGNRIDIQESLGKSNSPMREESTGNRKCQNMTRHLRGNWAAYWEHEVGRGVKDTRVNVKQIKLQMFNGHGNSVRHIIPLANENSFMSSSRDKTVRLWSLRSQGDGSAVCGPQWTYTGHRKSVLGCCLSERSRLAISTDSSVHVWDPWVGRHLANMDTSSGSSSGLSSSTGSLTGTQRPPAVNAVLALPSPSPLVLCATTDATIRSLDLRTFSYVSDLRVSSQSASGGLIRSMVVSPNCSWLAIGQASGTITVLDLLTGIIITNWKAHDAEILQLVAFDNQTLISSSLDQMVSVWNVSDGKNKYYLKGASEPVHCLNVCEGDIISGTTSNRIGVHSNIYPGPAQFTSSRLRTDTFKGVLTSIAVLPLNRLLLLGADSGNITLIC